MEFGKGMKRKMDSGEDEGEQFNKVSDEFEEEGDQFNKLSDDLIGLIISNLPTEEAVATRILSRRWRYQWKNVSKLNFIVEEEYPATKTSINGSPDFYVNNLLSQLRYASFKTCRITHYSYTAKCNDRLKYTVAFLLNKLGTEELAIKYNSYFLSNCLRGFSDGIFGCENHLKKIELDNYFMRKRGFFSLCVNLVTLKLSRLPWLNWRMDVGDIIKGCVLLENLVIEDCLRLPLRIGPDMRIKSLVLNRCSLRIFDIHVDTLQFLSLNSLENFLWHSCAIQCPNLKVLEIHCGYISFRFPIPHDLRILAIDKPVLHFPNLMVLRTTMDLNTLRHNLILPEVFRECTKLQEVDIFNEVDRDDNGSDYIPEEASMWTREFCESIVCHLRLFRIKGFSGREREMRLVDYLITSASKLKKLVIQFDKVTSEGEEGIICKLKQEVVKKEILSLLSRSFSSDVSVIFDSF